MPVILSQHFLASDRLYEDIEFGLYHYPRQYFARIKPYDTFVYYRPLGESQRRSDSLHYFGYGVLGQPWPDPVRSDHRYVPIVKGERFENPVPLRDPSGRYYETESRKQPVSVSAVREINEVAYYRILAAADVSATALQQRKSTEETAWPGMSAMLLNAPKDSLREIVAIPAGAGYVPRNSTPVDIHEVAALQERARGDHQSVLQALTAAIRGRGGRTWYNNNIDLLGEMDGERVLIEAKSLNSPADAVDRMRYGMGQLFDYRYRYRDEIGDARPVLAFGSPPAKRDAWIGSVLQENGVAFISRSGDEIVPMNELAERLAIFV